ncbi:MAG: Flp pilus assembly complex ATPase component TadA, partial [Gammaproteobacteria bacterium]|nr:Flp pilus assembly complex ATPase component TadA [Gammaproteobacteria bacterium]
HDPDVIMVGEIRDAETADVSTKASLTGHLVFSTLHTNDAPSAVTRLLDMGVEPYLLGSTLLGVMAQRLIRVNCPKCLAEEDVAPAIRQLMNLPADEKFYRGQGCPSCGYTGFKGRTTVCELMIVTPEIAALISESRPYREVCDMAVKQGMRRLGDNVIKLARMKRTSIEEAMTIRVES